MTANFTATSPYSFAITVRGESVLALIIRQIVLAMTFDEWDSRVVTGRLTQHRGCGVAQRRYGAIAKTIIGVRGLHRGIACRQTLRRSGFGTWALARFTV